MSRRLDEQMADEWMDDVTDAAGWMDRWMLDRQMDRWMNGWMLHRQMDG